MPFTLLDRRGGRHVLIKQPGDTVATALLRNAVPPTSVLTLCDGGTIVSDDHTIDPQRSYEARLIEGYDIAGIRRFFDSRDSSAPYLRRRLAVHEDGRLEMERNGLSVAEAAEHVETRVFETLAEFSLVDPADHVVLGLSGGVDSASLLMLLAAYRDAKAPELRLHAATFQDFDSKWSEAFAFAANLAQRHQVEHHVVPPEYAADVFRLNRPIAQILMHLMETEDAHLAMYVDHHSTRRVLERHANDLGLSKLALGLHTTDLLAGLLNSYTLGYGMGGIPQRTVGPYSYVFPLAFTPKRELQLYYLHRTGHHPKQTEPNQWEFNPTDRNFLYFVADHLQWLWPGLETWLFTAHADRAARAAPTFLTCQNCGGSVLDTGPEVTWGGLCDVCLVLAKHGWLRPS